MVKSYGKIQDYSAVENIDRNDENENKEDYDSKYSKDDLALLDMEAAQRTEEIQEKLRQSAEKGKMVMTDSTGIQPLSEAERLARNKQREQEALAELQKALAEARLSGQKSVRELPENTDNAKDGTTSMKGKIEVNENEVNSIDENATSSTVVKLVKRPSDYFHTLAENEPEPKLIKAIIDEISKR